MKPRAINDLCQLSDPAFFKEVSVGMGHVLENANRIESDAGVLARENRPRGFRILRGLAKEEAAKFLILLDAVRCPRQPGDVLNRQVTRFNQHLAKIIYAECSWWSYATFGEVKGYIEERLPEYYLDGFNDVDWIFRNRTLQEREENAYVDYIEMDGEHSWVSPKGKDGISLKPLGNSEPPVLTLVNGMNAIGFSGPKALAIIATKWRPVQIKDDLHWQELRRLNRQTLEAMDEAGVLIKRPAETYKEIVDEWRPPLCSLEIELKKVSQADLREIQERWTTDYY